MGIGKKKNAGGEGVREGKCGWKWCCLGEEASSHLFIPEGELPQGGSTESERGEL